MLPAALGSQVGGSIIRPAGFCGNFALKPTQGAINRGERQATSMSTHGPHAGSIEDMWLVAIEIAKRAGGDRGCRAVSGPARPPAAQKPNRLIVLETAGWGRTDEDSRTAFETWLEGVAAQGIEILRRSSCRQVEALECAIADGERIAGSITGWENRWGQRNIVNEKGGGIGGISARAMAVLERAERMTPADYEALLLERDAAQHVHRSVAPLADAAVSLSCPGPAPLWGGDKDGEPMVARPTGDAIFNYPSSMLFAPVVSIPVLAAGGLPVGVQVIGQQHEDARMTGLARWLWENTAAVSV
jgi:Asp-tRNA(Asn)/Glu-tRNA(Gln) amidotransferase A subunit family amidase